MTIIRDLRLVGSTVSGVLVGFLLAVMWSHSHYMTAYTAPATRVFSGDAGLVLNFIKPDKTTDFEATVTKLREALKSSTDRERHVQAKSWKIFRAKEPGADGSVLYVFMMDPAVKDDRREHSF